MCVMIVRASYYIVRNPSYALLRAGSASEAKRMYREVSGMRAEKIERISKTYAMREYLMFSNEADVVKESRKRKASVLLVQGDISMF